METDDPKKGYVRRVCPKCKGTKMQPDIIYHGPDQTCTRCNGRGYEDECVDGSDFVGGA